MIPTDDLKKFAQYKVVITTRQSDGARLIATRKVEDIKRPVRWDVEPSYPQAPFFREHERSIIEPPSTSKLIQKAREEGYGDWYPPIEKRVEMFPLDAIGDQSKMQLAPKYAEPDSIDYVVD